MEQTLLAAWIQLLRIGRDDTKLMAVCLLLC